MPDSAEYIPFFVFNDVHLWTMQSHALYEGKNAVRLKRDWSKLDPSFAGWVHKTILNEALTPDVCPDWVLASLNRHFTSVLWKRSLTVDDVDLPGGYDPRDHFDNGYIEESWKQVAIRLGQFKTAGVRNLDLFHRAAHAIGDFYAHSSYGEFGAVQNGWQHYQNRCIEVSGKEPTNAEKGFLFHRRTHPRLRYAFALSEMSWQINYKAAVPLYRAIDPQVTHENVNPEEAAITTTGPYGGLGGKTQYERLVEKMR